MASRTPFSQNNDYPPHPRFEKQGRQWRWGEWGRECLAFNVCQTPWESRTSCYLRAKRGDAGVTTGPTWGVLAAQGYSGASLKYGSRWSWQTGKNISCVCCIITLHCLVGSRYFGFSEPLVWIVEIKDVLLALLLPIVWLPVWKENNRTTSAAAEMLNELAKGSHESEFWNLILQVHFTNFK